MNLSSLTDDALFGRIEALARTERVSLIDLLIHLGELDSRPACQRKGFSSIFAYLTRHLGYAECDAMRRVRGARAAREYPSVRRLLAEGEVHLVGLALIHPFLTSENHKHLLRKASRRSTREIERLVAELSPPASGPRDRIRALPAPPPVPPDELQVNFAAASPLEPAQAGALFAEHAPPAPEPAGAASNRVVFTFTADEEVRGLFEQARDLLRHRFPSGGMQEIIGEALRLLVEKERPGLAAPKRRPFARADGTHRRRVPKWVEDEVWRRDGGRCAYVAADGTRCGETAWLELDHAVPFALGGPSDHPDNVRLLCRAHNQSEARRVLGEKRSPAART